MNDHFRDDSGEIRAAYVHVPFCAHRCGYCDFTLVARRDDLIPAYLEVLEIELRSLGQRRPVDTLFLGGGTPTHLDAPQLARLMELLGEWFELAVDVEFSVEANPLGLGREKINVLADAGVNRISLGVQSFDRNVLQTLERDHRRADIDAAVDNVRTRIDNVALDLIFGVPGQSLSLWEQTLQTAIEYQPTHLSTYGLTFEKGTAFWTRLSRGEMTAADVELEREMYARAMDCLPEAGYSQYEISNFAQPGFECRHNRNYWDGGSYWAFGPGAARHFHGHRETNHRSVFTWMKRLRAGQSAAADVEDLTVEQRARELAVLQLRQLSGIDERQFAVRTGHSVDELIGDRLAELIGNGWIEREADHVRLTREGRFVADSVIMEFL